jgi:hypothetical protein
VSQSSTLRTSPEIAPRRTACRIGRGLRSRQSVIEASKSCRMVAGLPEKTMPLRSVLLCQSRLDPDGACDGAGRSRIDASGFRSPSDGWGL